MMTEKMKKLRKSTWEKHCPLWFILEDLNRLH